MSQKIPLPDFPSETPKRFTVRDCEFMERAGILSERYELIGGEIIVKVGQQNQHALVISLLFAYLIRVFGARLVRSQATMEIEAGGDSFNRPEPDAVVLRQETSERRYVRANEVVLVVEVCDTTEGRDEMTELVADLLL